MDPQKINLGEIQNKFVSALDKLIAGLKWANETKDGRMADKLLRLTEKLNTAKIEYNQLLIDYTNFDLQFEKVPGLKDAVRRIEELCKEIEDLPLLRGLPDF